MWQTNLTWLDAVLTFAIGVIGSLSAVYIVWVTPRFLSYAANLYAKTSKQRAQRRIRKLNREMEDIDRFASNPGLHFGSLLRTVTLIILTYTAMTMTLIFVLWVIVIGSQERLMAKLDPGHISAFSDFFVQGNVALAAGVTVVLAVGMFSYWIRLTRRSHLARIIHGGVGFWEVSGD